MVTLLWSCPTTGVWFLNIGLCCWNVPWGDVNWENLNSWIFHEALKSCGCQCSLIRDHIGGRNQTFSGVACPLPRKVLVCLVMLETIFTFLRSFAKTSWSRLVFSPLCHFPFIWASLWYTRRKTHAYVHTRQASQMCDFSFISLITPAPGNLLPLLSNEFCHSLSDSQPALR